jgi:large subunit ribosomal protein L25
MEKQQIEVTKRDVTGKKVRFLRREGKTPASLYGRGFESIPLQTDTKSLKLILQKAGGTDLILLKMAGQKEPVNVLVREVQKETLSDILMHVDFYQVDMSQKIKANVPLVFVGDAPVLKKKNVSILHLMDSLHVEALPDHIPHKLEIDLSVLEDLDQAIHVKNVTLGADVTLLNDPEQIIAKAIEAKKEAEVVEAKAEVTEEAGAAAEAGAEKAEAGEEAKK